jgi:hypothetical protein
MEPVSEGGLVDEYAAAYAEWIDEGHAEDWDAVAGDGIEPDRMA